MATLWQTSLIVGASGLLVGCGGGTWDRWLSDRAAARSGAASTRSGIAQAQRPPQDPIAAVDVAIAETSPAERLRDYVGTTQPYRQVSVRSRTEGHVLRLVGEPGDPVQAGQVLAQLDGRLLAAEAAEAAAEVAAREMEVISAQTEVSEAIALAQEAELRLHQARSDRDRLQRLYDQGAIPEQEVETAQTTVGAAEKSWQAARERIRQQEQAVAVARKRVAAQGAISAQSQQRQDFTTVRSPVNGRVVARVLEPGSLAQPGSELLRVGDFSQLEVIVPVSDRDLARVRLGQAVQVRLDALPGQVLTGRVTQISPAADPVARQVPVEITVPNPGGRLGSGLLARVQWQDQSVQRIWVPESALEVGSSERQARTPAGNPGGNSAGNRAGNSAGNRAGNSEGHPAGNLDGGKTGRSVGTILMVQGTAANAQVVARPVTLGDRREGQVEILAGLEPGDRYVVRSSNPLQPGDPVRLSAISAPLAP
jgi:multidrug resistance efflux pump